MDYIVNFILQGETSFTPAVMIRFFLVVLCICEIFSLLHDLAGLRRF